MRSSLSLLKIYFFAGQFKIIPPDNPVIGVIGKGVILPCQLQAKTISERLSIQWIFTTNSENIDVSIYDGKNTQNPVTEDKRYQGRTNFFHTEFNKGNVSLYLKNVMVSDKGKYTCSVFFENWYDEVVVELSVAGEWKDRNFLPHSYCVLFLSDKQHLKRKLGKNIVHVHMHAICISEKCNISCLISFIHGSKSSQSHTRANKL
uniref:Ig-like domain-containing protein n=1 Tax=Nothoprocta perdicaria TaxID=30464 RepID=A0A8C7A3Q5_NOTPE